MTFTESYKQYSDSTRFLSKLASFLIAVILLVEVFSNLDNLIFSQPKWTGAYFDLLKLLTIQAIVGIIFAVRFVFLWLKRSKSIWVLQSIWFIGWLSVFAYFTSILGFPWRESEAGHIQYQISIYKSLFALIPFFYFLLSPIKQIIILIFSFFYRK